MPRRIPPSARFALFVAVVAAVLILVLRSDLFARTVLARVPSHVLSWARDRSFFDDRLVAIEFADRIDSKRAMPFGTSVNEWWPLIAKLRGCLPTDAAAGAYLLSRLAPAGGLDPHDDAIRAWLEASSDEATRDCLVFAMRHIQRSPEESRAVFLPLTRDPSAWVRAQSWMHLKAVGPLEAQDMPALRAAIARESHPTCAKVLQHLLAEWEATSP